MRVALCANLDTISKIWKDYLRETKYKPKVINDEEELKEFLSKHQKTTICLEDSWSKLALQEAIIRLKKEYPKAAIFILSQNPNFNEGMKFLQLGVQGYGNARMQSIHFQDALKSIKKGDNWVYPEFIQMMIKNINTVEYKKTTINDKLHPLSHREKEVAKLIYDGCTNQEIADITSITLRTVKAHTSSIYEKLQVKDRVALVLHLNDTNNLA